MVRNRRRTDRIRPIVASKSPAQQGNRLTNEDGLGELIADLRREVGDTPHAPRALPYESRSLIQRIEQEGPWPYLLEERRDRVTRDRQLGEALKSADERLDEPDYGLGAAIDALDAILWNVRETRNSQALQSLVAALRDHANRIPHPMFALRNGAKCSGSARADFEGEVGGLFHVLADELGSISAALKGQDDTAVQVRALAEQKASLHNWNDRTVASIYDRVIGRWRDLDTQATRSGRGRKGACKTIDRLRESKNFPETDEYGSLPRERHEALLIVRAATLEREYLSATLEREQARKGMLRWCIQFARFRWTGPGHL